jgi:hypothetical protein
MYSVRTMNTAASYLAALVMLRKRDQWWNVIMNENCCLLIMRLLHSRTSYGGAQLQGTEYSAGHVSAPRLRHDDSCYDIRTLYCRRELFVGMRCEGQDASPKPSSWVLLLPVKDGLWEFSISGSMFAIYSSISSTSHTVIQNRLEFWWYFFSTSV